MKIFFDDTYVIPLVKGHPFPITKYALLKEKVVSCGRFEPNEIHLPHPATDAVLTLVHDPEYVHRLKTGALSQRELSRIGFPWSESLVQRARLSCGGTIDACRAALEDGVAVNLAGGTHHAFPDHGEGYCIFNDGAVAVRVLQSEGRVSRAVILDCDAHQGNGTAEIFENDPAVFTFSIHGARNFPIRKKKSDLDIALDDGTRDADYLDALEEGLHTALTTARADLAIYVAGADPFEGDKLGRLSLSKHALAERDRLVLGYCMARGTPIAIAMGGGYAGRIEDTAGIHFQTVCLAEELEDRIKSKKRQ